MENTLAAGAGPVPEADAKTRLRLIREARSAALVGVSGNELRSSNFVASYLVRTHLRIYPVNPMYEEILGLKCYPSLADLPEVPDIVDVFRRPSELAGVTAEAIAAGARAVWFQLGLRDDDAARTAMAAGLEVVQNRCLKIEHARFAGRLNLAGFDTGVITSRRLREI